MAGSCTFVQDGLRSFSSGVALERGEEGRSQSIVDPETSGEGPDEQRRTGARVQQRRIATFVDAADPISRTGLASQLRGQSELTIVEDTARASVAVVVVDQSTTTDASIEDALLRNGCVNVAVIATSLDDTGVLKAVEAGACAIHVSGEATPERLRSRAAGQTEGHGTLPPDLLGFLLTQVGKLQRNVLQPHGLSSAASPNARSTCCA